MTDGNQAVNMRTLLGYYDSLYGTNYRNSEYATYQAVNMRTLLKFIDARNAENGAPSNLGSSSFATAQVVNVNTLKKVFKASNTIAPKQIFYANRPQSPVEFTVLRAKNILKIEFYTTYHLRTIEFYKKENGVKTTLSTDTSICSITVDNPSVGTILGVAFTYTIPRMVVGDDVLYVKITMLPYVQQ
jgi:hypothetical protein